MEQGTSDLQERGKFMNSVVLMGRLCGEPNIRYSQGDEPMCIASYILAVDRRSKKQEGADFISIKAFGKSGEFAEKYLHKGMKITLSGRIQTGSYTTRDGQTVYTTDVVALEQEFCESRRNTQPSDSNAAQGTPGASTAVSEGSADSFMQIPDGMDAELPFS